jgi:acetyltransferase-like isoleucine patch superfamily enzyme
MGNFIKKVKNYIFKKIFNKKLIQQKLSFEEKIKLGLNPNSDQNNISFFRNVDFKNSQIDNYSYISNNSIVYNTIIGKFCSIGPNAVIGFGDHPTHLLSTSPVFYSSDCSFDIKPDTSSFFGNQKVQIGNDVWIGANVFVKNGVTIGDGAIIGAGAVVLKDVLPYAIVVGVPAAIKSFRFSENTVKRLLQIKWWDISPEIIKENFELFSSEKIADNLELISKLKKENSNL